MCARSLKLGVLLKTMRSEKGMKIFWPCCISFLVGSKISNESNLIVSEWWICWEKKSKGNGIEMKEYWNLKPLSDPFPRFMCPGNRYWWFLNYVKLAQKICSTMWRLPLPRWVIETISISTTFGGWSPLGFKPYNHPFYLTILCTWLCFSFIIPITFHWCRYKKSSPFDFASWLALSLENVYSRDNEPSHGLFITYFSLTMESIK